MRLFNALLSSVPSGAVGQSRAKQISFRLLLFAQDLFDDDFWLPLDVRFPDSLPS